MSLLGKIAAVFSGGSATKVCVVDGDRLVGGDRVGPGERFQALNRLARFADREEMEIKVVFGGRPLREADEGAVYNGVEVFYGESPEEVRAKISKKLSSVGRAKAVLVTGDIALESEEMARGFAAMRTSTLRKAMDPGFEGGREGGGRGERGDRGDRGDREGGRRGGRSRSRGRRPQRSGNSSENTNSNESSENQNRQAPQSNGGNAGGDSSVKNLIDLVE